jgi:hypothetical protein
MELIYGNTTQEVQEIDILQNMSQELANSIATGPQDAFFASLDRFNDELRYQGLDSIDVTGKWNWKPGTYNVIKETVQRKLQMHKKCKGIYHFLQRTKDYSNYMSFILSQAEEMERLKWELKRLGVERNVNIEEFQEKANIFTNTVKEQCDLAYDASDGKVDIHPYFQITNNARNSDIFFEICIRNTIIDVYDGRENSKCIQRIDSGDSYIRIIARVSFRHLINKISRDIMYSGCFVSDSPLRHPYISTNHYNSNGTYGTVCLDKYRDDVNNSFKTINFLKLQHNLLSWAQYYHTQYSNPYNNIKYFHIGMPMEFSTEYEATVSNIVQDCTARLSPIYKIYESEENCNSLTKTCESIECCFMISCKLYGNALNVLECDEDTHYQYESIIGWLAERLEAKDDHFNYDLKDTIDEYLNIGNNAHNRKSLSETLYSYIHNIKLLNMPPNEFNYLLSDWGYWLTDKAVEKLDESNEEGIKEQMKAWATSPGRR